jgi:hypothetical protein
VRITLVLLPLLLHASVALSQPAATIVVRVLNNEHQPLPGARIKLLGTQRGAMANHAGVATVTRLEKGKSYDLEISIPGFYLDTVRNVVAGAPESQNILTTLTTRPIEYVRTPEQGPKYLEKQREQNTRGLTREDIIRTAVPDSTTSIIRGRRATETK